MPDKKKSLAEFGQTVKAKHPEYDDMSDEEVGRRVLQKYPQYSDMVDTAPPAPHVPPSRFERARQAVKDAAAKVQEKVDAVTDVTPAQRAGHSRFTNAAQDFGASAIQSATAPLVHPIATAEGMARMVRPDAGKAGIIESALGPEAAPAVHAYEGVRDELKNDPLSVAIPKLAGQAVGSYVGGKAMEPAVDAITSPVSRFAQRAADAVQNPADKAAAGIINRTVGARKADFARGSNPGRGYIKSRFGPSTSMESIADKAGAAKGDVAGQLQHAYARATGSGKIIPADDVLKTVDAVIDDAKNSASGPGVLTDPESYEDLRKTFNDSIADAWRKGGFTPQELWDIRKNIDRNLNWGDQAKLTMTKVQQQISGALGGLLKDAVPETRDLNQQYSDLTNLSNRTEQRALTHQSPLTSMAGKAALAGAGAVLGQGSPGTSLLGAAAGAALDSVPAKTALASGISTAPRVAGEAAATLGDTAPAAAALTPALGAVAADGQKNGVGDANDAENKQDGSDVSHMASVPNATPAPQPTIEEKTVTPADPAMGVKGVDLPVVVPPGPQSSLQPTPETHVFSPQQWLEAYPGGDHEAAAEAAREAGYEVA